MDDQLWPFQTVSLARWARLSERQKGMVEGAANKMMDFIEAARPAGATSRNISDARPVGRAVLSLVGGRKDGRHG